MVCVHLRQSKTDPFHKGVSIYMYLGITHGHLCPVTAILAYVAVRPSVSGPLFLFKDGSHLTREQFVQHLRQALKAAGMGTLVTVSAAARLLQLPSGVSKIQSLKCWGDGSLRHISSIYEHHVMHWRLCLQGS